MSQRPQLTPTAELEKLEQQITLTLQEIDHNFARAHRIITISILPAVERYSKESEAVWEGSKFWKQFFEASANIVLRNYEEDDLYHGGESLHNETTASTEDGDGHTYAGDTTVASSPGHYSQDRARDGEEDFAYGDDQARRGPDRHHEEEHEDDLLDDSLLESLNLTTNGPGVAQSTPKHARGGRGGGGGEWADVESPFEALRKELHSKSYGSPECHQPPSGFRNLSRFDSSSTLQPPSTPRARVGMLEDSDYSSPFRPPPQSADLRKTPAADPLMHRALDKNWRLQATPRGKPTSKYRAAPTVGTTPRQQLFSHRHPYDRAEDSSPISSPAEPRPQTQFFTTPGRGGLASTPGAKKPTSTPAGTNALGKYIYDSDSDDELLMPPGFSPPKTMQFSLPPSKLLATPAREASKRIVHDILQTAGASMDGDITMTTEGSSPFRGSAGEEDDPF